MIEVPHWYVLELYKQDGAWLGQVSVEPDWIPALECTRLAALRRGEAPEEAFTAAACIQPTWDAQIKEPCVAGFQVSLRLNGRPFTQEFRTTYFRQLAIKASAFFVEQGRLAQGELFHYLVAAYPRSARATLVGAAQEIAPHVPLGAGSLRSHLERSVPMGVVDAQDMPAFLPDELLGEVEELTRAHSGLEVGGVLIGRLLRDARRPEVFVEVTAQIPLRTPGSVTRLSFTPEFWTDVQAAIALRRGEEIALGYWHSHPVHAWRQEQNRECDSEQLGACTLARDYFSEEDRLLLRAVFPRAYSLGLVVNDGPLGELSFSLFGWRQGLIQPRGFYLIRGANDA